MEMNIESKIKETMDLLEILKAAQAKELAEPKSKRILIGKDSGFYVRESGFVFNNNNGFLPSICFIENDNAFIDQESAQLQAQRNALVYRMRVAALECPVDWNNTQDKYSTTWDFNNNNSDYVDTSWNIRYSQLPHFACEEKLREFMNSLSTYEQKLLICGVE
jgi:hypothetical protein